MAYTFIPLLNSILGRAGDYVSELRGRFHPTTGHTHDGTAGEGPKITGTNVDATWADWIPTVTQSGAVTVTVTEAKYCIIGDVCHIYARLAVTGSGSAGNTITIAGIPAAAQIAAAHWAIGTAVVQDNGTSWYTGIVRAPTTSSFDFQDTNGGGLIGGSPSWALANTDTIDFSATYRVA